MDMRYSYISILVQKITTDLNSFVVLIVPDFELCFGLALCSPEFCPPFWLALPYLGYSRAQLVKSACNASSMYSSLDWEIPGGSYMVAQFLHICLKLVCI